MSNQNHHKKKNLLKKAIQYGFHLWVLLFVSNLLIFYTYNLITHGAESESPVDAAVEEVSPAVTNTPMTEEITKMPSITVTPIIEPVIKKAKIVPAIPKGPVLTISFSLPGIGSGGGTMTPERKERNLTVFLYATDVNSYDSKIKPLHTIRTRAVFDENQFSPTYTAFINKSIDTGESVKPGNYQIAFVTDQSIITLVKEKPDSIGGKIVKLTKGTDKTVLPLQSVIMGDVSPETGDNILNIEDWNTFVDCYGKTEPCSAFKRVDFNDDGVIDGIDYNILARGYMAYHELGFPVPKLTEPQPTQVSKLSQLKLSPKVTKAPESKPSPSATPPPAKKGGNPAGALGGFFFFLIVLSGTAFGLSKTKFGKAFLATHPIPFLKPKQPKPGPEGPEAPEAAANATPEGQEPIPADPNQPPADAAAPPAEATPETIAESTEIPIESLQAEKAGGETPASTPAEPTAPTDGSIDKTYYVKNKSKDDKGTWVVLTDDAGPVDGLYKGDIEDGFERIKGTMTEENGKKYILITEVLPSE